MVWWLAPHAVSLLFTLYFFCFLVTVGGCQFLGLLLLLCSA